jgi:hypothetical protein
MSGKIVEVTLERSDRSCHDHLTLLVHLADGVRIPVLVHVDQFGGEHLVGGPAGASVIERVEEEASRRLEDGELTSTRSFAIWQDGRAYFLPVPASGEVDVANLTGPPPDP